MIRCFYSLYFRAQVPVGSANLIGRICQSKDLATMRGYIDVMTRTTFHLQGGIDAEVKSRNISPPNRKPSAVVIVVVMLVGVEVLAHDLRIGRGSGMG